MPVRVFSTLEVHTALRADYPILSILDSYCGVEWTPIELNRALVLEGSSLEVEAFPTGGDSPRYLRSEVAGAQAVGFSIREGNGGTFIYAPALAVLDDVIRARLESSECILVDGTFWRDDELVRLGIGTCLATEMGHLPLGGEGGSLTTLRNLGVRTVLVHVNNTNPALVENSAERETLALDGIELAFDGMEIDLG